MRMINWEKSLRVNRETHALRRPGAPIIQTDWKLAIQARENEAIAKENAKGHDLDRRALGKEVVHLVLN